MMSGLMSKASIRGIALGLFLPCGLLIFLEIAGANGHLPRYVVRPSIVLSTIWSLTVDGDLIGDTASSLFRIGMGFLIGAGSGALIGLAAGVVKPVERFYGPIVSFTYPVPKTAILPIAFSWFGLGDASKILVIATSVFYPTYLAAFYGARAVNKLHIWSAMNMGANRLQVFLRIVIPSALPQLFVGLRIGLGLAFVVMVVSELITSSNGLGYLIGQAEHNGRYDIMFAAIFVIGLVGFLSEQILNMARRRILAGQLAGEDANHD